MEIREYTPDQFEALTKAACHMGKNNSLLHRPFVDHYYCNNQWCRLYLLCDDPGRVIATVGIERMPFEYAGRKLMFANASNFYSLRRGTGRFLYQKWMEACEYTIVFGGSADMHGIMRNKKWKYCAPVKMCYLNRGRTIYAGDSWPKATLKRVLNALRRRSLSEFAAQSSDPGITVVEETNYSADLLPSRSEFRFRFTPTVEYLNWRYSTRLSFAHYRLFRILRDKETIGYVIIQEFADRLVVAQCDGSSALELAAGVMTAILKVGSNDVKPRSVILSCSHSEMLKAYEEFGVDTSTEERPLVIGAPDGQVDIEDDNSRWLINFDWGDNGLRAPFPD